MIVYGIGDLVLPNKIGMSINAMLLIAVKQLYLTHSFYLRGSIFLMKQAGWRISVFGIMTLKVGELYQFRSDWLECGCLMDILAIR